MYVGLFRQFGNFFVICHNHFLGQTMTKKKNFLIKDSPSRNPGQLLDKEIDKILGDDVIRHITISFFCIVFTGLEWWRWYDEQTSSPVLLTLMTLIVTMFSLYKLIWHN